MGREVGQRDSSWWARAVIALCGAGIWLFLWGFAHTDRTLAMRPRQMALFFAAFALFGLACGLVWRLGWRADRRLAWAVVIAGVVFRLSVAPVRPVTTSDIYRYLWEGKLVRMGMNPYHLPPSSPELAGMRDRWWELVQHKSVPAAYPPVAQYVFALSGLLPWHPVTSLKLVLALFDVATVLLLPGLLARVGRPPGWVLAYAWHPLVVGEVVARGHLDSIGLFLLVVALRLALAPGRSAGAAAGAALAASALSKGYSLLLFPIFAAAMRGRQVAFWGAAALVGAAAYAPFLGAGTGILHGAAAYAGRWEGNASVYALLKWLAGLAGGATAARPATAALILGWAVWRMRLAARGPGRLPEESLITLAGLFLLSPVVYPWYLAWTVPLLCLRAAPGWLVLTGTIFGFYAHDFAGHHVEIWWVTALEYGLPLVAAAAGWAGARRGRANDGVDTSLGGLCHEGSHRKPALSGAGEHDSG